MGLERGPCGDGERASWGWGEVPLGMGGGPCGDGERSPADEEKPRVSLQSPSLTLACLSGSRNDEGVSSS